MENCEVICLTSKNDFQDSHTLLALSPGQTARLKSLLLNGHIRRRLLDLGLTGHTKITCVGRSPCGDPKAYRIRDAVIAIRNCDSSKILTLPPDQKAQELTPLKPNAKTPSSQPRRSAFEVFTGYPAMFLLLALVLWLTIAGANVPSRLLSEALFYVQDLLTALFVRLGAPDWLHGLLVLGAYRVLAWVVSVMLPPMAIFFPLFTLLEDWGYLPRAAYCLDHAFSRCRSCGKQALTMCMSFGCNAVGVTGCRIIESPRERLLAVLTSSFVPCNGRFPALIALLTLFFAGEDGTPLPGSSLLSALLLAALIVGCIGVTLLISRLLSSTVLKGLPSFFTLELPPFRRPRIGPVLIRSLLDRTLFVLGRAVSAAAPAGALLWLLANIHVNGASLLGLLARTLDPFASLFGLDGTILMAFLLGLPANEIVLPIMLMGYLEQGVLTDTGSLLSLRDLLTAHGWTSVTAVCTLIFMLFHWPCATTLLTVRKETGSLRWTLLAAALPAATGFLLCFLVAWGSRIF